MVHLDTNPARFWWWFGGRAPAGHQARQGNGAGLDLQYYPEAAVLEDSGDGILIRAALSDVARGLDLRLRIEPALHDPAA